MKKIISIALLTAMLLTCFAGCAMQKGEVDVENYVEEAEAQDTAVTIPTDWKNGLTAWDGSVDETWYDADKTEFEIADGADLRAFIVAVRTNKVTFAGKKITVTKDINLGGKEWAAIVSDNNDGGVFFAGEFDGNNKIIGNFKMTLNDDVKDTNLSSNTDACNTADAVGGHALLGSIGNGAILKDLKVVEATYIVNYTSEKSSVVGGVVAEINNNATLSNIYVSGSITETGSTKISMHGGIAGKAKGSGTILIENCVSNVTISAKGARVAGIVANVNNGVKKITVSGCEVTAPVTGSGQVAGIIAMFENDASKTKLTATIKDCQIKANLSCNGNIVGGVIAQPNSTGRNYYIDNCDIAKNVTIYSSGHQNGGLVGIIAAQATNDDGKPQYSFNISNCDVSATINFPSANGQNGGFIGTTNTYITNITNCTFDGVMTSDRSSGGFIGSIGTNNKYTSVKIVDSKMMGTLNFDLKGTNNLYAGGFVGLARIGSGALLIEGCTMGGTLNMTFNANSASTTENGGFGGLIGTANDKGDGTSTNNSHKACGFFILRDNLVNGTLNFQDKDTTADAKPHYTGILVGNTAGVVQNLQLGGNYYNDGTKGISVTGNALGLFGDTSLLRQTVDVVGYQTTEVVDGKYDLRIVASTKNDIEALGFIVNVKYFDENGEILGDKMVTEYVEKVYTSINGDGNTYKASDFYADYLYTLTIKNIPASVTAENMGIQIHAIAADVVKGEGDVADTVTYLRGAFTTYGTYKSMASKNDVVIADSEETALDATLADVLGEGNVAEISKNLLGGYQDNYYSGVAEVNNAVYPSTNAPYEVAADAREANVFTVTINAEVAGEYDIILEIRAKDASVRSTYMYINDQDGYFIHNDKYVNADSYNSDNTNNANSRFVKIGTCTLKAGRNTVTFKIDNEIGGVLHPRAIYFDAVAK